MKFHKRSDLGVPDSELNAQTKQQCSVQREK